MAVSKNARGQALVSAELRYIFFELILIASLFQAGRLIVSSNLGFGSIGRCWLMAGFSVFVAATAGVVRQAVLYMADDSNKEVEKHWDTWKQRIETTRVAHESLSQIAGFALPMAMSTAVFLTVYTSGETYERGIDEEPYDPGTTLMTFSVAMWLVGVPPIIVQAPCMIVLLYVCYSLDTCTASRNLAAGIGVLALAPAVGKAGSVLLGGALARDDVLHIVMAISMLLLGRGGAGLRLCNRMLTVEDE